MSHVSKSYARGQVKAVDDLCLQVDSGDTTINMLVVEESRAQCRRP